MNIIRMIDYSAVCKSKSVYHTTFCDSDFSTKIVIKLLSTFPFQSTLMASAAEHWINSIFFQGKRVQSLVHVCEKWGKSRLLYFKKHSFELVESL